MNERYNELVKQATIRVNNPTVNSDGKVICDNWEEGISISKLINLVIKECTENFTKVWYEQGLDVRGAELGKFMKQFNEHFGDE